VRVRGGLVAQFPAPLKDQVLRAWKAAGPRDEEHGRSLCFSGARGTARELASTGLTVLGVAASAAALIVTGWIPHRRARRSGHGTPA
jgi:hypothetical protein